ncbi:MAG: hypothetical protein N3G78_04080 [Desulfobacterota bacterium]|nr:hypothetical protein [Thermodesulfobacteriota bacterium]
MIRRFNYTGRKRIPRPKLSFSLRKSSKNTLSFDASIDFTSLDLPGSAQIYIEAYRRAYFQRFACGTVSAPRFPVNSPLEGLDPDALVLFRVKVVDRKGRILASADSIRPKRKEEDEGARESLLPVEFVDLGNLVWRLDLEGDLPILQLNKRVENIREIARSDGHFLGLVYPEVFRQILLKIVVEEDCNDPDAEAGDEVEGMGQWLRFAIQVLGRRHLPPPGQSEPARQQKLRWIDEVVEAFCSNHQVLERFVKEQRPKGK